jgi:putative addiction module component (TIGR02574 family)
LAEDGDTILLVTREDLLSAALNLPLDERAALADRLLRSLDDLPEPERKRLWLEVSDRRLQEMREAKVREIPADEVFARGRAITSR